MLRVVGTVDGVWFANWCGWRQAVAAAAAVAALVFATGGDAAPAGSRFAPTPNGPIAGGIPGAMPSTFRYVQEGGYQGWPIAPTHAQHPVRGSFLDPRGQDDTGTSGYHFGIDISVDDEHPERGEPQLLSHRVYAVEPGTVSVRADELSHPCLDRRVEVGHFAYWHVSPVVQAGRRVLAGQQIGWSCIGVWHVHLSEWQRDQGQLVWVNPLHAGTPLAPYTDTAPPVVAALDFVTPATKPWLPTISLAQRDTSTPLSPARLHPCVGSTKLSRVGPPPQL